jgi:hypothetical protein
MRVEIMILVVVHDSHLIARAEEFVVRTLQHGSTAQVRQGGEGAIAAGLGARSPKLSAEDGRTGFRRRDPDQAAALFDHGGPVVVPVRMLPGDGAVVLD